MDEWYDIGTHIICKTCLGKEISGILVAYDIDQKLIFLKRTYDASFSVSQRSPNLTDQTAKSRKDAANNTQSSTVMNGTIDSQVPSSSTISAQVSSSTPSSNNASSSANAASSSSFASTSPAAASYVLVNLRWVSAIEEIRDEQSTKNSTLIADYMQKTADADTNTNSYDSETSNTAHKNPTANGNAAAAAGDYSLDQLDKTQQALISSVMPPNKLDIANR
jgi:hypothetical protein